MCTFMSQIQVDNAPRMLHVATPFARFIDNHLGVGGCQGGQVQSAQCIELNFIFGTRRRQLRGRKDCWHVCMVEGVHEGGCTHTEPWFWGMHV